MFDDDGLNALDKGLALHHLLNRLLDALAFRFLFKPHLHAQLGEIRDDIARCTAGSKADVDGGVLLAAGKSHQLDDVMAHLQDGGGVFHAEHKAGVRRLSVKFQLVAHRALARKAVAGAFIAGRLHDDDDVGLSADLVHLFAGIAAADLLVGVIEHADVQVLQNLWVRVERNVIHGGVAVFHVADAGAVDVFLVHREGALFGCAVRKDGVHVADKHHIIVIGGAVGDLHQSARLGADVVVNDVPAQVPVPAFDHVGDLVDARRVMGAAVDVDQRFQLLEVQI